MSWDTAGGGGGSTWESIPADPRPIVWQPDENTTQFDVPAADGFGNGGHSDNEIGFAGGDDSGGNKRGGCFNCGQDGHTKAECPEPSKPRTCFNCNQEGHSKADCPEPPKSRACFNCGEEGHSKVDCPHPTVQREFTGTCRLCDQVGHRAADCPTAPPKLCKNCQEEGHSANDCKNPRKIDRSGIADIPAEYAWNELVAASAEGDLDDMKEAIAKYIKATPDVTYVDLEKAFRIQGLQIYIIALEKELQPTYTNMDLQGNLDKKYSVSFRKSPKHARPKEKDLWPASPEENLERLLDAGEPVDRGIPKCSNCEQLGHMSKSCPEEKQENADRPMVKCFNCDEVGHRVRDCPNPRPDRFACRNCKQSGHSSKDCPEPRSAEGVECKKCGEVGHFSRDCPQGGGGGGACHNCGEEGHRSKDCTNERKIICRNCDAEGHLGKECPKPRDYSRVKCSNCDLFGHTKVRCKEPIKDEGGDGGSGGGDAGVYGGDSGGNDYGASDKFGISGGNDYGASDKFGVSGGDNFGATDTQLDSATAGGATADSWGGGGGVTGW